MIQNVFVMQIAYFTCSGEDFQSQRFRKYLVIAEVKLGKAVSFKSAYRFSIVYFSLFKNIDLFYNYRKVRVFSFVKPTLPKCKL